MRLTVTDNDRQRHETLDILVNNAGRYEKPDTSLPAFGEQTELILNTNYWGLKNVINAFLPMMSDAARIVNMNSNYGHVSHIPGREIKQKLGR